MKLKRAMNWFLVFFLLACLASCGGSGPANDNGDSGDSGTEGNIYTVTYSANGADGGVVPEDATEYTEGDEATVLGNTGTLLRTGYYFNGWNTMADGSGDSYEEGNTLSLEDGDVVLYAVWVDPSVVPLVHYAFDFRDVTDGTTIIDHGIAGANALVEGRVAMAGTTDENGVSDEALRATGGGRNSILISRADMVDKVNPYIEDEITVVFKARLEGYNSGYNTPNTFVNMANESATKVIRFDFGVQGTNDFRYIFHTATNSVANHFDYKAPLTPQWRQYAITYKNHTMKFFIDGVQYHLRYSPTGDLPEFNGAAQLMTMDENTGQTGCMSDFRIYSRALSSAQIRALNDNLVVHYPMDDNSADADPKLDLIATGELDGTATETRVDPDRYVLSQYQNKFGAMSFNGASSYMEIPNLNDHLGTVFTVSAWAKADSAEDSDAWAIISNRNSTLIQGFMIGTHSSCPGQWLFQVNNGSWNSTLPVSGTRANIRTTGWQHIVGTYDGSTAKLYVDGVLAGSVGVSDYQPADGPVFIGKRNQSDIPFDGKIDDVRFYAKALSAADVLRIYEDDRYVRGYVDCDYPYDDCNPTLHSVKSSVENIVHSQTEGHGCFNPDTPATGAFDHWQGASKFLPPRGNRIIFSRSDSQTENIVFDTAPYSGSCNDEDALAEWAYDPGSLYRHHHAGGIQSIGRFLIAALDDNGNGGGPEPGYFHTVFYDADTIVSAPYKPSLICYEDSVPRNTGLGYLAWSSIGKVRNGKYIWTNGYYSGSSFYRLKTYMTQNDDLTELGPEDEMGGCSSTQFNQILEIDLNNNFRGDYWGTCDHENCNEAGEYQNGFYLNQSDGKIFLLLSSFAYDGWFSHHGYPYVFELKIDKMIADGKHGELVWVYGDLTSSTRIENVQGDFKAGVDYHINENGELIVIASDLNAGVGYNVDYDIIRAQ